MVYRSYTPDTTKQQNKVTQHPSTLSNTTHRCISTYLHLNRSTNCVVPMPNFTNFNRLVIPFTLPWLFWGYTLSNLTLLLSIQNSNYFKSNIFSFLAQSRSARVFTSASRPGHRWIHPSWYLLKNKLILSKLSNTIVYKRRTYTTLFRHPVSSLWLTNSVLRAGLYRLTNPQSAKYRLNPTSVGLLYNPIKKWRGKAKKLQQASYTLDIGGNIVNGSAIINKISSALSASKFFSSLLNVDPYIHNNSDLPRVTRRIFVNRKNVKVKRSSVRHFLHLSGISTLDSFTSNSVRGDSQFKLFLRNIGLHCSSTSLGSSNYYPTSLRYTLSHNPTSWVFTQTNLLTKSIVDNYSGSRCAYPVNYNSTRLNVYRAVTHSFGYPARRITKSSTHLFVKLLLVLLKVDTPHRMLSTTFSSSKSSNYAKLRVFKFLSRRRWPLLITKSFQVNPPMRHTVSELVTPSQTISQKHTTLFNRLLGSVMQQKFTFGSKTTGADSRVDTIDNSSNSAKGYLNSQFIETLFLDYKPILLSKELLATLFRSIRFNQDSAFLSAINKLQLKSKAPTILNRYGFQYASTTSTYSLVNRVRRRSSRSVISTYNQPTFGNSKVSSPLTLKIFTWFRGYRKIKTFSRLLRIRSKLFNLCGLLSLWTHHNLTTFNYKVRTHLSTKYVNFNTKFARILNSFTTRGVITKFTLPTLYNWSNLVDNSLYIKLNTNSTFLRSSFFSVQYLLLWKLYPTTGLAKLRLKDKAGFYQFFKFTQFKKTLFKRLLARKHRLDSYRASHFALRVSRYKKLGNSFIHNQLLSPQEYGKNSYPMSLFPTSHYQDLRSLFWSARPTNTQGSRNTLPRIKKTRFKPGYQRLWRLERSNIKNVLSLNHRYQYRLTTKLHLLYFATRKMNLTSQTLRLNHTLVLIHFASDLICSKSLILNEYVYVNGSLITNDNLVLFTNDFIQLLVNLRFYTLSRWFSGLANLSFKKWVRRYYRTYRVRRKLFREFKVRSLPVSILNVQHSGYDIPKMYEVDYFSCSAFILFTPSHFQSSVPNTTNDVKIGVLNMYNWKYIT